MLSSTNPVHDALSGRQIDRSGLKPMLHLMPNGQPLYYFNDPHVEMLKIDLLFEGGTIVQDKKFQAMAAVNMLGMGTSRRSEQEVADFMDFRGIVFSRSCDEVSASFSVVTLSRYLGELLPLLREMVEQPSYAQSDFVPFIAKRKQNLLTKYRQTSFVAGKAFYESLYGPDHPYGCYAAPADMDLLGPADLHSYHDAWLRPSQAVLVVAGRVDDGVLRAFDGVFGQEPYRPATKVVVPAARPQACGMRRVAVEGAVQNSLRIGLRLPFGWCDRDYATFMVLSTILGGYFGSRLMTTIREEKGYTYGIYSMTRMRRDSLSFGIISDVAAERADDAVADIVAEMRRLCDEPVGDEELTLVRNCMVGDFMRSVDGVFERSERFCQMLTCGIDERFTDNYFDAIEPDNPSCATPQRMQAMAQRLFDPEQMVLVSAGA